MNLQILEVGARCACPISGAKHRAPTIGTIVPVTFYEIIKVQSTVIGWIFVPEWVAGAPTICEPFEPAEDFGEEIEAG